MPRTLDEETALTQAGDGVWEGAVAEGWDTPRGPLGGYVMGLMLRGLELAVGDAERPARSATMHFARAPVAGPVTVSATVQREGRSLSTVSGRMEQDGKLIGLALGAYSKAWEGPVLDESPMPEVEPASGRATLAEAMGDGPPPEGMPPRDPPPFMSRLTMQPRFGQAPFTQADRAEVGGWIGLAEERPLDAPAVALLADAWFPAPWPRLRELAPAPTIDLTMHFRAALPLPDSLLLGRFRTRMVRDGFFEEDGELWTPDGTLVAQSRQLGLLLGAKA